MKKKIEAMLKEVNKEIDEIQRQRSKNLPTSESRWDMLWTKRSLLTSLLSNAEGEVKEGIVYEEYCSKCGQLTLRTVISASEASQPTERRLQMTNQQTPSATDKMTDIQKEAITGFTNWKEGLSVYNTPSATVDEMREATADNITSYIKKRIDEECFNPDDAKVYIGELLKYLISDIHSQQEKRYTREQMLKYGGTCWKNGFDFDAGYSEFKNPDEALDQFDKEGK